MTADINKPHFQSDSLDDVICERLFLHSNSVRMHVAQRLDVKRLLLELEH